MRERKSEAEKYIRKIRNNDKRAYAWSYYRFLRGMSDAPSRPDSLSVIAAQAVILILDDYQSRGLLTP
jgi:hypothetical protein